MRNTRVTRSLLAIAAVATLAVTGCAVPESDGPSHAESVIAEAESSIKADAPKDENVKAAPNMSMAQEQAVSSALDYLEFSPFSKAGLIKQLSSKYADAFKRADAVYAVNHIKVDWMEQAARSAKDYLSHDSFSRTGLIQQLESEYGEGFTHAQAIYGVNQAGL